MTSPNLYPSGDALEEYLGKIYAKYRLPKEPTEVEIGIKALGILGDEDGESTFDAIEMVLGHSVSSGDFNNENPWLIHVLAAANPEDAYGFLLLQKEWEQTDQEMLDRQFPIQPQ